MALDPQDPFALNIQGVTDLVESKLNKVPTDSEGGKEGVSGEKYDAYSLDMDDEALLKLRDEYEKKYAPYESKMKPIFSRNLESYLGKKKDGQFLTSTGGPSAANLQFEAEETFLAAALAKNPEPVVWADNTPEGNAISNSVKTMLTFHSEHLCIKRRLAHMVRQWSIYHLGVLKYGWDPKVNDVFIDNRRIQNFIFDPQGYVDVYGDFVGFLGERVEVTADKLIEMFPDHADYIKEKVDGKLGSTVIYTEWWSADDTFTFTTFERKVLAKNKNQYFKYEEPTIDPMTQQPVIDPMTGAPMMIEARNHFAQPKKPYTFLSVYSLQEQPHDITGNVEQNIPNQKKITDRTEQIDFNIAASNNGYAFSEDNFNQETAKQAANARRKGNPILVPSGGPIDKAIYPLPAQDLPAAIFNEVEIAKNDLRSSWGIVGITSTANDDDNTVRGEIIEQANDTTRIGGGIGDSIEVVAKSAFNWLTQLYYVFYDEQHFAAIMGNAKAVEYVTLSNQDLDRQLIVSVAPDSLKPKDEVTQINMAQALFDKGAIGPKTLLKMLDFPNPDEAAADGMLYRLDPMSYLQLNFPDFAAKMQAAQQQQMMMQAQAQQGLTPPGQGGIAPEDITEPAPPEGLSRGPVDTKLSQIQMPPIPQG